MEAIAQEIGYFTGSVNGFLTGRRDLPRRLSYRPMLKDVLDRIDRRLKEVGLSATAASKKAGLGEDAIRNLRRAVEKDDRVGISTKTLTALAPVLGTTASWLLEGSGPREALVRIIGRVGADTEGTVIMTTGQEAGDMAPVPPSGNSECYALEVRGHSMRGLADDGALVYISDQRTPPTPDMLGHVVLVELEDGRVLVKRLLRGSKPGVYDLESIVGPTLEDQRIVWAAHVIAIVPPYEARRIIVRHGMVA